MKESDWKIIDALSRTPNITQTAENLFMTQPTLSKRLQHIEEELGVQIVVRFPKGVVFTPEGEYLAAEARKLTDQFDTIRKNLLRIGDGESGTIQLGMTNAFARSILPQFLNQYKQLHPNVYIDISTDVSTVVVSLLEQYRIHVGFIRGELGKDFERHLISVDQACLASKSEVTLEDLPHIPQIHYLADPFAQKLLEQWWYDRFTVPPLVGMHANHGDTCREMVLNGLGYGIFLSPGFIDHDANLFKMPLFYRDGTPFTRKSWIIWRKDSYELPVIKKFIDFMRENIHV